MRVNDLTYPAHHITEPDLTSPQPPPSITTITQQTPSFHKSYQNHLSNLLLLCYLHLQ